MVDTRMLRHAFGFNSDDIKNTRINTVRDLWGVGMISSMLPDLFFAFL